MFEHLCYFDHISDKDEITVGPVSQHFQLSGSCGTYENPHHCSERVGDVDPGGVANLSWAKWVICKDKLKLEPRSVVVFRHGGSAKTNILDSHF